MSLVHHRVQGGGGRHRSSVSPTCISSYRSHDGWTIRHVLDTHVHADHLSRARELARRTGAMLFLPRQDRVRFAFTPLADGDHVSMGAARLSAIHTPGHTNESTSYMLERRRHLHGRYVVHRWRRSSRSARRSGGARVPERARYSSRSIDCGASTDVVVLPGHASEPIAFDGRAIATPVGDVPRGCPDGSSRSRHSWTV